MAELNHPVRVQKELERGELIHAVSFRDCKQFRPRENAQNLPALGLKEPELGSIWASGKIATKNIRAQKDPSLSGRKKKLV